MTSNFFCVNMKLFIVGINVAWMIKIKKVIHSSKFIVFGMQDYVQYSCLTRILLVHKMERTIEQRRNS